MPVYTLFTLLCWPLTIILTYHACQSKRLASNDNVGVALLALWAFTVAQTFVWNLFR